MAKGIVREVDDAELKEILGSEELPVVVDFYAPWCGPCKAIGPFMESLAEKFKGKARFLKINVDDHKQMANKFDVRGIPRIFLFKNGEPEDNVLGGYEGKIRQMVENAV